MITKEMAEERDKINKQLNTTYLLEVNEHYKYEIGVSFWPVGMVWITFTSIHDTKETWVGFLIILMIQTSC